MKLLDAPNIVWVVTDDQPFDAYDGSNMPYLTGGFGGVQFPQSTNVCPICNPSRLTHFSGRHARRNGEASNSPPAGSVEAVVNPRRLLPRTMQRAGYRTYFVGKYLAPGPELLDQPDQEIPQGWDRYASTRPNRYFNNLYHTGGPTRDQSIVGYDTAMSGADVYRTDLDVDKTIEFINLADDRPFFMCLAPSAPHRDANEEIHPAPRHADLAVTLDLSPSFNEADISDKPAWLRNRWPNQFGQSKADSYVAEHTACLRAMRAIDEGVESIVDHLTAIGKLDNTIIMFWGDNGFLWGEHRHDFGKGVPYRESLRLGLVVRWPGVAPRIDNALMTNMDIPVTTAALAGTRLPILPDGMNMARRIKNPNVAWRDATLIERDIEGSSSWYGVGTYSAVTTGLTIGHTYVEHADGDVELYDHIADPYELDNIAGTGDPVEAQMAARLAGLLTER